MNKHLITFEKLSSLLISLQNKDCILLPLKEGSTFYQACNVVSSTAKNYNLKGIKCEAFKGVNLQTDELINFVKITKD